MSLLKDGSAIQKYRIAATSSAKHLNRNAICILRLYYVVW